MLLPYTTLTYHGPGAGAAIEPPNQPTATATLKGLGRVAAVHATAPTALARINDGRQLRAVHTTAPTAYARPSGKGRMLAVGKVNELSQDDVVGAVFSAKVDGEYSFLDVVRLLAAANSGKSGKTALGGGSTEHRYRNLSDTKDVIAATVNAAGERVAVTKDVT